MIAIQGCSPVSVRANTDSRGFLSEVYREEWPGAFRTVQWNACASKAGVLRGTHVHADYHEFYTLPTGRVFIALKDIRRHSTTFGRCTGFEWSPKDGIAIPVPAGVAHAVYFLEDSVLVFGLSNYWRSESREMGCRWDDLDSSICWPMTAPQLSEKDAASGSFKEMLARYDALTTTAATK
jgi:dTDP-4-dehydrorhamnose 3,5-epimerase